MLLVVCFAEELEMKLWKLPVVALLALSVVGQASPSFAKKPKGAPGPVAGAGLPLLIAAGAYWLMRRRNSRMGDADNK
jgi:hypothetical protein